MYRKFHKLRVRFAELDMSQNEVARRAGIAPATMTTRMTGRFPFTATEIIALAKVLEIPLDQIGPFFLEDAPQEAKKKGV